MIINSFFTDIGVPRTGLSPTVRIWEVDVSAHSLVVTDAAMTEVGGGFYKYDFTTYDTTKNYVIRSDGGAILADSERYEVAATEELKVEDAVITDIVNGVWDETATNHLTAGSTGEMLSQIKADTGSLAISIVTINSLINTLLKYEKNRTKIDVAAKTLTIFDDDCVTPLTVFNLKDSSGNASVAEVCDRVPSTCP